VAGEPGNVKDIIQLDSELNKIQDVDILLERILLEARNVTDADAGTIYVKEGNKLVFKYSQNDTKQRDLPSGQKLIYSFFSTEINEKTISGYTALTGYIVNIPDVYELSRDLPYSFSKTYDKLSEYRTVSMLSIPLKASTGQILGVLQLINSMSPTGDIVPFTKDHEVFSEHFAATATTALQRARMTRSMILRMIKMSELRDPKETGAHVNRVSGYALEIYERWAQRNGVPMVEMERYRDVLKLAAMLHDVGKVAVSDLILKKPAKFTDEEYRVMQGHTWLGAKLFDDIQSELDVLCAEVALTHHENWDGSGYPGYVNPESGEPLEVDAEGKPRTRKGTEIPLPGRIVAIADVYDALMSRRVYKEPWDEARVYEEIKKMSGAKFDPDLVDIFFEILPNIKQVRNRYPDQD
jgi:HD-GYP domain-containing protein (c-di-GMP phosphodiesterase class II)